MMLILAPLQSSSLLVLGRFLSRVSRASEAVIPFALYRFIFFLIEFLMIFLEKRFAGSVLR